MDHLHRHEGKGSTRPAYTEFCLHSAPDLTECPATFQIHSKTGHLEYPIDELETAMALVGRRGQTLAFARSHIPWRPVADCLAPHFLPEEEEHNQVSSPIFIRSPKHPGGEIELKGNGDFMGRIAKRLPIFGLDPGLQDETLQGFEQTLKSFGTMAGELGYHKLTARLFRTRGVKGGVESYWHRDYPFTARIKDAPYQLRYLVTLHSVTPFIPGSERSYSGGTALFPPELMTKQRNEALAVLYAQLNRALKAKKDRDIKRFDQEIDRKIAGWAHAEFGDHYPYTTPGIGVLFTGGSDGVLHRAPREGIELSHRVVFSINATR